MIVLYNIIVVFVLALIVKLGVTYTDYEEYFVALGVIDIVYLSCVIMYIFIN
jgi:hypothetical protein